MQHLPLCLVLFQIAASSLLFFGHGNVDCSGVASISLDHARFYIRDGKLVVEGRSSNLEVHHHGPEALHGRLDGVREGSLVIANSKDSVHRVEQDRNMGGMIEYWRYLFHAGEVGFDDMARKIKELDGNVNVYLVAKPGTNAGEYRFEKRPLEYPRLSGLEDLVSDYGLIDVALEDPSLEWVDFILHAHPDLVDAWTSTVDRALKLVGIIVCSVITKKAIRDQALEALRRLTGCSLAARRLLSAQESGASVQEAIRSVVSSAHPLLEVVRIGRKSLRHAPYLRALGIEVFYYAERTLPGRVEMAHDVVELQDAGQIRCEKISWGDAKLPDPDVLKKTVERLQRDPDFRDDVATMFVCLKYSVLVPDMKEALVKESMKVCQKHQLQEAIPMLFMLSFGRCVWGRFGGFYQRLKLCQSIEVIFETIRSFVGESREHECMRQSYWKLHCRGMPSSAPHFADFALNAMSRPGVFELPYCQDVDCVWWAMSKDVLFRCIGEALSRPMGLVCDLRRVLSHLSHKESSAGWISLRTCIDSMRPSWHSQCTLSDAVAEFVYGNGPPLMRRILAFWVHEMKLRDRAIPELPNRVVLVELVREVPEGSRLRPAYYEAHFSESGAGAAEVASRWMLANPDYSVLSRLFVNGAVCILEDGLVAMSGYAFRDHNTADSLARYAGPRTVAQLSKTISSRHSHISVRADRQSSRIKMCRIVGNELHSGYWTRSVVLRWSPGRGVSLFMFSRNQKQTVCFSADKVALELLCIFRCNSCGDLDENLAEYRSGAGTIGTSTVRFDSDVVPTVHENGDLDSLTSPSSVEVRLTEANKANPVVRVLSECLDGMPYMLRDVQTWEHMERMLRELGGNLIAAFRVFDGQ